MPFDTFILELAFFLGSVKILASLPTDPYFHPWHDGPPSYRISHGPYQSPLLGRNEPRIENGGFSAFTRENFGGGRGESQDKWYPYEQRSGASQTSQWVFPLTPQSRHEIESPPPLQRRSYDNGHFQTEGQESANVGAQSIGNSYSSHVNCEAANQKSKEPQETSETVRQNNKFILNSDSEDVERITFKGLPRNLRNENSRDFEIVNARIVTPKGGRRPPQGNPGKNQNKPFNTGATNTISSTEKTFNNHTAKGPKRPRPRPQDDDIIFPDGFPKKFVPKVSKCAKKLTFCENLGEEYPSEYINQILKKEGAKFKEFFGNDIISDPNITERINAPEENSLCPSRLDVIYPKAAQNKENNWLFVVNQDNWEQGISVEICLQEGSRCILTENFPLGYTPYCKQKYIERRLTALGEDGKLRSDIFKIPSCCSCVVKLDSSARMGFIGSSRGAHSYPQH